MTETDVVETNLSFTSYFYTKMHAFNKKSKITLCHVNSQKLLLN